MSVCFTEAHRGTEFTEFLNLNFVSNYLKISFLAAASSLLFSTCLTYDQPYQKVAPGIWRGILELEKINYPAKDKKKKDIVLRLEDQTQMGELPFNFEVKYESDTSFFIEIINGSERITCREVSWGRDRTTARDTIHIEFPEYQSYLRADVRGDLMTGEWVNESKGNYRIPFRAKAAQPFRFTTLQEKPAADLSGEWAAEFGLNEETQDKAIAEFEQQGNRLTGTFRTETGDYRFLEGTVQGDKFWLSCFDGSHAFLFSGKMSGDSLLGEFRSGKHYKTLWRGWRDPNFKLGNPDSLVVAKMDARGLSFDLKNERGEPVKFPSARFVGKVKIFSVSGTWCPNCRDEQVFLTNFLKKNPDLAKQIEVVVLSFERNKDEAKALAQLKRYRQTMNLPYEIVWAGDAKKESAAKVLPALSDVMAFPTMVILDKKDRIRRVHTGFDGPATSKFGDFEKDFANLIQELTQTN